MPNLSYETSLIGIKMNLNGFSQRLFLTQRQEATRSVVYYYRNNIQIVLTPNFEFIWFSCAQFVYCNITSVISTISKACAVYNQFSVIQRDSPIYWSDCCAVLDPSYRACAWAATSTAQRQFSPHGKLCHAGGAGQNCSFIAHSCRGNMDKCERI